MKKTVPFTVLLLLAVLSAAAWGGGYAIKAAGVKFSMPDSWEAESSNLGIMFTSPSGDMILTVGAMHADQLGDVLEMADEKVRMVMTDVEYEEGERETEINGFSGMVFSAWGKSENSDTFANFIVLGAENDHRILIFSMGEAKSWDNNIEDIQALCDSILPADQP